MFHRPRTGLQLHPVMSSPENSQSTDTATVKYKESVKYEESFAEPTPAPAYDSTPTASDIPTTPAPMDQTTETVAPTNLDTPNDQPLSQPTDTKETETMTNTYNNPSYAENDAGNAVSTATSAPAFAAAPVRVGMPQQMVRSPYAYNQGYAAPATTSDMNAVSTGRKLVLGEGITMSGEIEACDHLVVEGTVEASLKGASVLEISQSGMFFGAVEINEATIAGRFEGDLVVNGRLTIRSTGTVMGTIAYKELAVEAGATIDGKISPMSVNRVATTDKKALTTKTNAQSGKSENGSELPFASKNAAAA